MRARTRSGAATPSWRVLSAWWRPRSFPLPFSACAPQPCFSLLLSRQHLRPRHPQSLYFEYLNALSAIPAAQASGLFGYHVVPSHVIFANQLSEGHFLYNGLMSIQAFSTVPPLLARTPCCSCRRRADCLDASAFAAAARRRCRSCGHGVLPRCRRVLPCSVAPGIRRRLLLRCRAQVSKKEYLIIQGVGSEAAVISADIPVCHGVVHIVDQARVAGRGQHDVRWRLSSDFWVLGGDPAFLF